MLPFWKKKKKVESVIDLWTLRQLEHNFLDNFDFKGRKIGAEGAKEIADAIKCNTNTSLMKLQLHWNGIGPEGARALAEVLENDTTLKELALVSNEIGAEGAMVLADVLQKNSTLTTLNLGDNSVGDEGARALAIALEKNNTLTELSLWQNGIQNEGARALANALEKNNTLVKLNLASNKIQNEGARVLADAFEKSNALTNLAFHYNFKVKDKDTTDRIRIQNNRHYTRKEIERLRMNDLTLTELKFEEKDISAGGAKALAGALENNTSLTELRLWKNNIGDEGAGALADALVKNAALTSLWLGGSNIGPEGARALGNALALKQNTVTRLGLDVNKIGNEGARALADILKNNNTLTLLQLKDNDIGAEGARALADALEKNTTLTFLGLDKNKIGAEGAMALVDALKKNGTLKNLALKENNIGIEAADALLDAKEQSDTLTELGIDAEAEKRAAMRREAEEEKQKLIEEGRKQAEAEMKKKAKEEAEEAKKAVVPTIAPEDCKIMVSFNNFSAGEDAELLTKYLTRNGHPTFCTRLYCPENSGSWRDVTVKGVRSCIYYIMLMTNGWQKSKECQYETKIAINRVAKKKLTLIPVWYKDFDFDYDEAGDGYDDQFGSVQSVQRERSAWMNIILKQLGGGKEGISLENQTKNDEQENDKQENDEHENDQHDDHAGNENDKHEGNENDEHKPTPNSFITTQPSILSRKTRFLESTAGNEESTMVAEESSKTKTVEESMTLDAKKIFSIDCELSDTVQKWDKAISTVTGSVVGPNINATIVPPSNHTLFALPGPAQIKQDSMTATIKMGTESISMTLMGRSAEATGATFQGGAFFETSSEKYQWLNGEVLLAHGTRVSSKQITFDCFSTQPLK